MLSETVFKAMADGTRRRILQVVSQHELNVSELVDCLRVPQSTVSRHLKVLRDARLLQDRREGSTVVYALPEWCANGADRPALQSRLVEWVGDQELPRGLRDRLEQVLDRRQHESTEFFSRVGLRWDRMRIDAFGDQFHLEALTALLPGDWKVADIGSGTGYLLPTLARTTLAVGRMDWTQPDQPILYWTVGRLFLLQGRPAEAERALQSLIVRFPDSSWAHRAAELIGQGR